MPAVRKTDKTNQRFGRLIAMKWQSKKGYQCRCDCGNELWVKSSGLGKDTHSCGCLYKDTRRSSSATHGKSRTSPEFWVWVAMRQRCSNPQMKCFKNYGGRGITVCKRWEDSFANFYEDMGPRPSKYLSIERINNDGNYEPDNCKWATRVEQNNNTRRNKANKVSAICHQVTT